MYIYREREMVGWLVVFYAMLSPRSLLNAKPCLYVFPNECSVGKLLKLASSHLFVSK